jgi:hypothetical protein
MCPKTSLRIALASARLMASSWSMPGLQSHAPAESVQAYLGRQGHQALGPGPVIAGWRDGEDESALPEADLLDQNRVAGIGQHDDITGLDVTNQDHVIHIVYDTARKGRFHPSRERDMCCARTTGNATLRKLVRPAAADNWR